MPIDLDKLQIEEQEKYYEINKKYKGNYLTIEEFKSDLDWEFIKKFMKGVCDELMIKY